MGAGIEQLYIFAAFGAFGAVAAFLYHLISFIKPVKHKRLTDTVKDTLFAALFLASLWLFNLKFNNGQFRLFVPLGVAFGAALYVLTCKRALDKAKVSLYNLFTEKKADENDDGKDILQ